MGLNREDRINAIAQFRYTERQARFLELVLRHGGVCVPRQYATCRSSSSPRSHFLCQSA